MIAEATNHHVIDAVGQDDAGVYECTADNNVPPVAVVSIRVNVECKLLFIVYSYTPASYSVICVYTYVYFRNTLVHTQCPSRLCKWSLDQKYIF